ncbi:MAG: hypothetical protein HY901_32805 [Deltaproteobacteria bacterium]|nr:hypothetical protein [Deltaproteobacteria bacterium]
MRSWTISLLAVLLMSGGAWAQEGLEEQDPGLGIAEDLALKQAQNIASHRHRAGPPTILADETPIKLPWSELSKLLEQARKARPERAPIPYALGEARLEGELDGRILIVRVAVPVHLADDGWTAVPLWRAPVAVRRATLDGKPAAVALEHGSLVLLAKGQGAHKLWAELVIAPAGSGEQAQLGFATPVSASWNLRLPGTAARIEPAVHQSSRAERGGVTLEASTAPAETVSLDWTGVKVSATPARVSAESFTYVTFQEGTTFGRSTF